MAEIKTSDILNASEINKDLQDIIDKFNQLLAAMKQTSGEFQKSTNSTKKMTEADKKAAEEKKQQIAAEKALIAEKKKQLALEQKQAALLEKQAQKQKELIEAATKEVKTLGDLNAKLAARRKLIQGLEMGTDAYNEMAESIAELAKQQDIANSGLGIFNQRVGNYQKAADTVNMSLGEMKKELRELRNMSFANLNPEEITQIRDRMAELTDSIGDFQAQIRTASADRIPALMDGLQGLVAVAQGVTGTLAIFGVETEKLDKAMVQLIGVSQALKTIQELQEKGTLRVAWATAKDTAAKAANAVAAKGQAMATTGATAATRALGKAMMTNPYMAIAVAIAAVTTGVILLVKAFKEQDEAMKKVIENANKAKGEIQAEQFAMNQMFEALKKTNVGSAERKKLTAEINELYKDYLPSLLSEKTSLEDINKAQIAANDSLKANIFMKAKRQELEAIEAKLAELYTEQRQELEIISKINSGEITHIKSSTRDNLIEAEGQLGRINNRIAEQEKLWQDITKYYDSQIPTQIQMTKEQQDAMDAYNKSLSIKSEGEKKGKENADKVNQSYKSYLETIEKIKRDYLLLLPMLKTEDDIKNASIDRDQKLYDASLDYYKKVTPEMQKMMDSYKIIVDDAERLQRVGGLQVTNPNDIQLIKEAAAETENYYMKMFNLVNGFDFTATKPKTFFEEMIESAKKFSEFWAKNGEAIETTLSGISEGVSGVYDNQINKQQLAADNNAKYFDNLLENYDQDSAEYQQLLAQKEAAQERYQARLVELERKKAAFDKVKALIDITINTAKGIISALASGNPILSAAIGVAGAVQAGVVASQPLPQYYVGLDSADKDHFGSVAERGPELVNYPDGTSELFTKPTITFIPKYTSIDTAAETAKKLAGAQFTADLTELNNSSRESIKYLGIIARNTQTRQSATDIHYINKYLK